MTQTKIHTPLPLVNSEEELADLQKHLPKRGPRGGMVVWVEGQECVKIPLSQSKFTIIDVADYDLVGRFRWCAHKRIKRDGFSASRNWWDGRVHYMELQRLLMGFPVLFVDHKNRDPLDNRRNNLRLATRSQNGANAIKRCGSTSKFKGVYWASDVLGWFAEAVKNNQHFKDGPFVIEDEAAYAYDQLAIKLFGEYARTNFTSL